MKRIEVKEGDRYGRLTIVREVEQRKYQRFIECKCDCGNTKEFNMYKVLSGVATGCGCGILNNSGQFKKNQDAHNKTHGDSMKDTKHYYIHKLWMRIKRKCYNPNDHKYYRYGARGIKMYEPWINDYQLFKSWILDNLGERPYNTSLDRINNNKHYEPYNLRWATPSQQAYNREPYKRKKEHMT